MASHQRRAEASPNPIIDRIRKRCPSSSIAARDDLRDLHVPYAKSQLVRSVDDVQQNQAWAEFEAAQKDVLKELDKEGQTAHYHLYERQSRYTSVERIRTDTRDHVEIGVTSILGRDQRVVQKALRKSASSKQQLQLEREVETEIKCLRILARDTTNARMHIIEFVESYTDETEIGLLLKPVCTYNLKHFMKVAAGKYDRHLLFFFTCLLRTLCYLHEKQIRHRDIKPGNILVKLDSSRPRIYVCDFGIAYDFSNRCEITNTNTEGTDKYMAPELTRDSMNHDHLTDVWSLGCVFLEMHVVASGLDMEAFRIDMGGHGWSYWQKRHQALVWCKKACENQQDDHALRSTASLRKVMIESMLMENREDRPNFQVLYEQAKWNSKMVDEDCSCHTSQIPANLFVSSPSYEGFPKQQNDEVTNEELNKQLTPDHTTGTTQYSVTVKLADLQLRARYNPVRAPQKYGDDWKEASRILSKDVCISIHLGKDNHSRESWQMNLCLIFTSPGFEQSLWLPYSFVKVYYHQNKVILRWSDYKQVKKTYTNRSGGVGAPDHPHYEYQHDRDRDNRRLRVVFDRSQDAADFAEAVMPLCPPGFPRSGLANSTIFDLRSRETARICDPNPDASADRVLCCILGVDVIEESRMFYQLRTLYIDGTVDFVLRLKRKDDNSFAEVIFHSAREPVYRSDRGKKGTPSGENEINAAPAALCPVPTPVLLHFPYQEPPQRLVPHQACEDFVKCLTGWDLLWASGFEELSALVGRPKFWRRLAKDKKPSFVAVWRKQAQKFITFRWTERSSSSSNAAGIPELDVAWMMVQGHTQSASSQKKRMIEIENSPYKAGKKVRVDVPDLRGENWMKDYDQSLTLRVYLRTEADTAGLLAWMDVPGENGRR